MTRSALISTFNRNAGQCLLPRPVAGSVKLCYSWGLCSCLPAHFSFSGRSAAWLARLVRDQEVEGSNPFAPTTFTLFSLGHSLCRCCLQNL
jgi:hypothetical protein